MQIQYILQAAQNKRLHIPCQKKFYTQGMQKIIEGSWSCGQGKETKGRKSFELNISFDTPCCESESIKYKTQ